MNNEYYGAPTRPNDDFLAHYGIKGMKWGVRKAVSSGSDRRLGRQYAKASRKLAKLERRAANGKKYAKRAALMGAGAAAAGGLAALGTSGVSTALSKGGVAAMNASKSVGYGLAKIPGKNAVSQLARKTGSAMYYNSGKLGNRIGQGALAVNKWGQGHSIGKAVEGGIRNANVHAVGGLNKAVGVGNNISKSVSDKAASAASKARGMTNNTYARIGAGVLGAGKARFVRGAEGKLHVGSRRDGSVRFFTPDVPGIVDQFVVHWNHSKLL